MAPVIAQREVAGVAGADEDAVEHEHAPAIGCMSATDHRTGTQLVAHRGVVA